MLHGIKHGYGIDGFSEDSAKIPQRILHGSLGEICVKFVILL